MTLVVITGATRGIGLAAATELAGAGAELALVGRERERVDAAVRAAEGAGGGTPWDRSAELVGLPADAVA